MPAPAPKIVVIASFMMDLTTKLKRVPRRGETVFGYDFKIGPGGKGSNQAVCAKRLGAQVTIIAKLGNDLFGKEALKSYKKEGFDTTLVFIDPEHATGVAPIFVEDSGENIIAIIPGANSHLTPKEVEKGIKKIKSAAVLLANFEVPIETTYYALKTAKENDITTILNPAPAPIEPIDESIYKMVDILTPNETEAMGIVRGPGPEGDDPHEFKPQPVAEALLAKGVKNVVITLGQSGAFYTDGRESEFLKAFKVNTVDATGAGDAFNGALAVAIGEGRYIKDCVVYANMVAALSTTRFGTAPAMPHRAEVEKWRKFANETQLNLGNG